MNIWEKLANKINPKPRFSDAVFEFIQKNPNETGLTIMVAMQNSDICKDSKTLGIGVGEMVRDALEKLRESGRIIDFNGRYFACRVVNHLETIGI